MLWNLLDGRAYTASELAMAADVSSTSASNHLTKLLEAELLKVEIQGRHRYFSFARPEVAYAVESLANLANQTIDNRPKALPTNQISGKDGIKYCRTCYDHLAGFVGVKIMEGFQSRRMIKKINGDYEVTGAGWKCLSELGISKNELVNTRRRLVRECLDCSERRPHLAGQLGALVLSATLEKKWFKKIRFSREMVVTSKGSKEIYDLLGVQV